MNDARRVSSVSMHIFAILLLGLPLFADPAGEPQISIVNVGESRRSVVSRIEIRTTPERALNLLLGGRCSEWLTYCVRAETVPVARDSYLSYSVTDLPWPVSDRDVVFQNRVEHGSDGSILVRFEARPDLRPLDPAYVRITDLRGYWSFRPEAGGRTFVTYAFSTDPGGLFPDWFVERSLRLQPEDSLRRMKQILESR